MSGRLDQEREERLNPQRMQFCQEKLEAAGFQVTVRGDKQLEFEFKGAIVRFWPYSGWASGRTIKDGRGFDKLMAQVRSAPSLGEAGGTFARAVGDAVSAVGRSIERTLLPPVLVTMTVGRAGLKLKAGDKVRLNNTDMTVVSREVNRRWKWLPFAKTVVIELRGERKINPGGDHANRN